jgi:hypothetical protein
VKAYDAAFVGALFFRFPELMPLLQEHLNDFDDTFLPHVLMGDITRWIVLQFHQDPNDPTLRQMLSFIEAAFERASHDDRELIAVSFLENLPRVGQEDADIRAILGPALQNELQQIG